MSEETKKPETMEDYMNEINASFSNFRDADLGQADPDERG